MNTNGISGASGASAAYAAKPVQSAGNGSDGGNDAAKASAASKIGPAVIMSLSNTAQAKAPDAAQGDPDHDGK